MEHAQNGYALSRRAEQNHVGKSVDPGEADIVKGLSEELRVGKDIIEPRVHPFAKSVSESDRDAVVPRDRIGKVGRDERMEP